MNDLLTRDRVIAGVEKLRFFPLVVEAGEGCELIEPGGRRLLDLSATWTACALGHGHPVVHCKARIAVEPSSASVPTRHAPAGFTWRSAPTQQRTW